MELPEIDKEILDSHFKEYRLSNTRLLIKLLFLNNNKSRILIYGRIRPLLDDENLSEENLIYNNVEYYQFISLADELITQSLINGDLVSEAQIISHIYHYTINKIEFYSSLVEINREKSLNWFFETGGFHPKSKTIFSLRYPNPSINFYITPETFDAELPYFPNLYDLIELKFQFDPSKFSTNHSIHLELFPPTGFISDFSTKEGQICVSIHNIKENDLTLKLYCKGSKIETFNYKSNNSKEFHIPDNFEKINAILVDNKGILLDTKEFVNKKNQSTNEIEEIIYNGENEVVDFKEWDPKSKDPERPFKFSKILCSFANTHGGKILFGINDESDVVGIEEIEIDEIIKFLTEICARNTIPRVNFVFAKYEIQNKILLIITILKSPSIVQNLYNEHYYIRKGSTNRIFRPEEISSFNTKSSW